MDKERILKDGEAFARRLLEGDSSGHGYDHIERVVYNAKAILKKEKADAFIVLLACLLHDVDDDKLFPESKDLDHARAFLKEEQVEEDVANSILSCIKTVSFKGKETKVPETIEGKIVQDADRLDAIGAIGIARAFAYGGKHDRLLYKENEVYRTDMTFQEYRQGKVRRSPISMRSSSFSRT